MPTKDPVYVLLSRRRLTDAMHAMHVDQRVIVDEDLARELETAWDEYDAAIRAVVYDDATQGHDD